MDLHLNGKIALVTGTGSQLGMGREIALTLAREGCDIIASDMDLEGAKKTAADVIALGRKAIALKVDIVNTAEVEGMVKEALKQFGRIDILINAAGSATPDKPFHEKEDAEWKRDININLIGTMNCAKAVLPGMIAQKYGKIVNIASLAVEFAPPGVVPYTAAKTGLLGFTKALANEAGPSGINVNSVSPGPVLTNFIPNRPKEVVDRLTTMIPLRRMTKVDDIANMVVFLASDVAKNVTGETIPVDGGGLR